MAKESRVKKTLLNVRVNLICYMFSVIVLFFTRGILLENLGTEFIGLTGTLQSLLGFLNLAELGVGTAIGYVLYKPIFDDDKVKINEIISVFGYLYRCIGLVILGAGIILSAFLPWIFPDTTFSWGVIYFGFYAFLTSSMLGYFVNYRQTLLSADQRNYEVTGYYQVVVNIKTVLQALLAIYITSFQLYFILEIVFGVIYSMILTYRINKVYPWLRSDIKLGKQLFKKYPEIGKYIKQLFVHKIGTFVQYQISPFFVYSYVSLPMVALYSNYTLLTQRIQNFVTGVIDSTGAGIGNLISEGNSEKIYNVYKELFSIRLLIASFFSICVYNFATPIITLWLGEEYALSNTVILLISAQCFLVLFRGVIDQFLFGYGLFYDVFAPVVESLIFLATVIILGPIWGLIGVLSAPLISTLIIVYLWKPYFLYHKGFKKSVIYFFIIFIQHLLIFFTAYYSTVYLFRLYYEEASLYNSWFQLIGGIIFFSLLILCFSIILFYIFSSGFRAFVLRFIKKKQK